MVELLALLVLLVAAAIASFLAWTGTRTGFSLLLTLIFAVASGVVLSISISRQDDLQIAGVEQAQAEGAETTPSTETRTPEAPAIEGTIPGATDAPTAIPTPTATPVQLPSAQGPSFVVEAATEMAQFDAPTSFAIGDSGEVYVGHTFGIEVARDTTGDGYYDYTNHFALDGGWVFGLDYYEGYLYAAVAGSALRLRDLDGDDVADEIVTLVEGLPHNLYGGHSNSGLAVGPDGLLYMAIGGTSDHGPELEPFGGTILTMGLDGGVPQLHASGFRNPYDLAFCPDGRLFAVDNGPDQLDDELTFRPWDEVNLIVPGGDYGYPDYFGPVPPETGTLSPVARVAPSAGITGITCYTGSAYPERYQNDLFVTLWGTFTYPVESGRRVMWVDLEETPEGLQATALEFAGGFGHPIDVLQDPHGQLLVLDHERGQVFRIRHTGESQ